MSSLEHLIHHTPALFIGCTRNQTYHVIDRSPMIHENPYSLKVDKGRVLDKNAVLREFCCKLLRDHRLRLCTPDHIMVTWRYDNLHTGREVPHLSLIHISEPTRRTPISYAV